MWRGKEFLSSALQPCLAWRIKAARACTKIMLVGDFKRLLLGLLLQCDVCLGVSFGKSSVSRFS